MQEGIKELEAEMSRIKATLDEKTKLVDEAKRVASKAAKALEQAEKEISSRVGMSHSAHYFCDSVLSEFDDNFESRTTTLRGWGSSARVCTANVASKRSSYRWSLGISRTFPWRRFVIPDFPQSLL
jgi:hypothetical protein